MKYPLGDMLADYGFSFLEKLHVPILLVHKSGAVNKINEAGRKLLCVAHITRAELDGFIKTTLIPEMALSPVDCQVFPTKGNQIKMISKQLGTSDYLLVELIR